MPKNTDPDLKNEGVNVSEEKALEQYQQLQPPEFKQPEAPKDALPGSSPLHTMEDDPEVLAAYLGSDQPLGGEVRKAWFRNAYNQPVLAGY